MSALGVTFTGILGLIFGSFGTVAAWRIPRRENIVAGRSHCPRCGAMITALENVPVLSWVFLRGRCRHCGNPISIRYPLIELTTGVLFALSAAKFGWSIETFVFAAFFWVLVVLTVIDLDHKLLPNRVVYPAFVAGWGGLVAAAIAADDTDRLLDAAIGAAIFGGTFFVIFVVADWYYGRKGLNAFGFGDVKLAFVLGTFLGYLRIALVPLGMMLAFFLGAVISIAIMAVTRASTKLEVPFGPYLALGTVLTVFIGDPIVDWYAGLL